MSQTRAGRQVMTLNGDTKAKVCLPLTGDLVAAIGENRKLVIFPVADLPTLSKGRGVTLQKYRQGALSDIKIFKEAEGLSWIRNGKAAKETDLRPWRARRGAIGRLAPISFPRNNMFEDRKVADYGACYRTRTGTTFGRQILSLLCLPNSTKQAP